MFMLFNFLMRKWRERQARAAGADAQARPGQAEAAAGRPGAARVIDPEVPRQSPADRGLVALIAHQARYDLLAGVRNPRARFFTFFFPIVLLVVFNGVFGSGHTTVFGTTVELSRFYVPGILAMSIVVASYANLVISITALRESGVLKRRRATPVSPSLLVTGQALSTVVITLIMAAILLLIAKIFYGVGMSAGSLAAIAITTVVATISFSCIGYAVSILIGSPEAAQPLVQATMLPLWFISGVFIPNASLSSGLRKVGDLFPVAHLASALHLASVRSTFSSSLSGSDLLVLVAWGVAAVLFCAWRFSWLPSTATA